VPVLRGCHCPALPFYRLCSNPMEKAGREGEAGSGPGCGSKKQRDRERYKRGQ